MQPWIAITSYLSMTVTEVATTYGCNRITSPFRYSICSRTPHYTGKLGNVLLRYGASCGGMRRHQVLTNETKYTLRRWLRIQKKNLFITKYMNSGLHAYVRIDGRDLSAKSLPAHEHGRGRARRRGAASNPWLVGLIRWRPDLSVLRNSHCGDIEVIAALCCPQHSVSAARRVPGSVREAGCYLAILGLGGVRSGGSRIMCGSQSFRRRNACA